MISMMRTRIMTRSATDMVQTIWSTCVQGAITFNQPLRKNLIKATLLQ